MNELSEIKVPYPNADAKNLFVRDDKKRNYYLITVWLKTEDLIRIIKEHGNLVKLIPIS